MQLIEVQKWSILADRDVTEDVYALMETSGAELCGCEPCFNFAAARHLAYSSELLELLECLGIDPLLESSVSHLERLPSGLHAYCGWFHLVGRICSGPATPIAQRVDGPALSLVHVGENLSLGFSADRASAPEAFFGLPVVGLAFRAEVPWVSNAAEPD